MSGMECWLPLAVVLFIAVPIAFLWIQDSRAGRLYRVESCRLRCPIDGKPLAHCTLVRDAKTGQPIGIRRCDALVDPEKVRCGKPCLPLFARVAGREMPAAAAA